MEKINVSSSFEQFLKDFDFETQMQKVLKRSNNGTHEKSDLSFIYKKGSSTCIKIAEDIAEQIGISDYVGISYFPDEKMFVISSSFSTTGVLYPVIYNKSDKKYRCYRTELFNTLTENAGIRFDDRTCVSYHNAKIEEHPKLGTIARVYINEG